MTFNDGSGSILLQGFVLADGEICIKAMLEWTGAPRPGLQAIYPKGNFNWPGAACRVAEAWLDGPPTLEVAVAGNGAAEQAVETDSLAAAG